jgi:sodium pump decarboxylase gamma subunit
MNVLGETLEITVIGLSVVFLVLLLLTIILKIQGWLMETFFLKKKKRSTKQNKEDKRIIKKEKKIRAVIAAALDSYLNDYPSEFNIQEGKRMQKYKIKIDDEIYEVEVERVDEDNNEIKSINKSSSQSKSKFSTVSKNTNKPTEKESTAKKRAAEIKRKNKSTTSGVSEDEVEIKAPMPGQILMISVAEGDEVQEGDHLAVLEAMKMENDITAPKDGVIKEVFVKEGKEVNSGDNLFIIN